MTNLIRRLRDPAFGTETSERNLMAAAADEIERHTEVYRPRPYCDWHEDCGDVLWWLIPISEAPYVGSPLCLGRTMVVEVSIGREHFELPAQQTGGWPFEAEDERHLWWTPLPDAKRIEDQVPL